MILISMISKDSCDIKHNVLCYLLELSSFRYINRCFVIADISATAVDSHIM